MTKFFFLTSLSCGVHSPRRCPYRALLCDHENKRFVIIVLRGELQQADGRLGKAVQHVLTRVWDKNNPFSWGDDSPAHRVVALEVDWSSIVGIDYRCPLHDDGKLVLEARKVLKRCFKTVEDARDFYSPRAAEVRPRWLRTSHSAAPTPSKMSLDGRHAMLASVSCAHLGSSHLPVSPRLPRHISCGPAAPASAAGALRPVASATVASTAAAASGTVRAGGDWCVVGRRRALGPGVGARQGVQPEPGPRSVSATRAPRTGAAAAHVGRAAGTCTLAPTARRSCLDYASADEGEGGNRHRRPAPAAAAAAARASGGAGGATAATGGSARRRLQLRMVESLAAAGLGESTACSTELAEPPACGSTGHTRQPQQVEASPRKAKSTNDLCGMERERGYAHSTLTSAAAGSASNARTGLGSQSTERCTSATATTAHISGVHRCDATACYASWDYSGSLAGVSARSRGGGDSSGAVCSSSVDSLRAAFMSQKYQQLVAGELNSRRRLGGGGGGRVRRDATSWTHLSDAGFDGLVGGGGDSSQVPRASRWTQPSATYCSNTLVLSFRDPFLPQELRRFVKSDMRLLKLYESGLPAWAVFMPSYGLPYRPWLRRALWLLFIAISVFSMGCGFYDLYKNVPFLKQVVTAVASRMYLPASELFEWLERHTQIRMSILLTYLFSKSPLLVSLMRAVRSLAALLQQLLRPVAAALSGALAPLAAALQAAAASVVGGVATACAAVWRAAQPVVAAAVVSGREAAALAAAVLGPPARALWGLAVLLAQLVRLVAALIGMVLVGPVQLACSIGGALSWAGGELAEQLAAAAMATARAVQWLLTLGRAARRAAPAVKAGARLAAQAAAAGSGGMGSGGLSGGMAVWHWLGLEVVGAYNAVRLTFLQAFKSAQAVMNFCVTVANTAVQHRVSLLLQLRRFITRQKERLPPAVAASVPLPAFVSLPSFSSLAPFDIPLPGPDPDIDLLEMDAAGVGADPAVGLAGVAAGGLAEHRTPAEHHRSMYDMDMDVVLTGCSEDEDLGSILAAAQPQLYGSDAGGVLGSDGGGSDAGGSFSEPIPIPLGGEGHGIAGGSGAGLRRRRLHGGAGGRMGHGGGGGGNQRYGLYMAPRQRLDAVDEEDMEDAQQLSDRDGLESDPGSGGRSADSGGGVYVPHDRRRPKDGTGGTSGLGRNPWARGRGHMDGGLCAQAAFEDADYLAYASAPGCGNLGQGGGGGLVAEDGLNDGYALRPSLSSPSRWQGRGLKSAPLSRSVPAASGPAVYAHGRHPASGPRRESASGQREPQWQQQQQEPLLNDKQHRQQHSRRAKRQLARSASVPADRTSAACAADAHDGADNDAGKLAHGEFGGTNGRCTTISCRANAESALTAGAVAAGAAPALGCGTEPVAYGVGNDPLTCSSPFVRRYGRHHAASQPAGGPHMAGGSGPSGGAASGAAQGGRAGTAAVGKAAAAGEDGTRNHGRGDGGDGANNACGKRNGVGAKHVGRQAAIQAA